MIWRLGQGGDFAVSSSDPSPWFLHQHHPHYVDGSTLLLFDNGNTRRVSDPDAHSRGQAWWLDERTMRATQVLNVDLGNYSAELGTAERMPNGNYVFGSGSQGSLLGQSIEVLPDGTRVYVQEVGAREYRSFRTGSLYGAPESHDEMFGGYCSFGRSTTPQLVKAQINAVHCRGETP